MISPKEKIKAFRDAHDRIAGKGYKVYDILSGAKKARKFSLNTCPLSRHLQLAGESLIKEGKYQLFVDDPVYMGVSFVEAATLIWQLRDEVKRLKKELKGKAA